MPGELSMSIKDRLIQFVLRGKDELSPEAKKSAAALEALALDVQQVVAGDRVLLQGREPGEGSSHSARLPCSTAVACMHGSRFHRHPPRTGR